MAENRFYLASSPHFSLNLSTQKIMLAVVIALLPECIYGVAVFGFRALAVILAGVAGSVLFELLFLAATRQKIVIKNLSAVVSGIMLSLVCPPTIPLWQVLIGSFVAMVVAKGLFGGIGSNVFNPALTGRAVLFLSFPSAMGARWIDPARVSEGLDGISSATALSSIKNGSLSIEGFDFASYFFGNRAGCIGETSVFLILVSFAFLMLFRIVDWRAPLSMVVTVFAGTFIHSAVKTADLHGALMNGLVSLLTGGLVFGAAFMVTDYATTPATRPGRLLFGFGCGMITFLIRSFGGYPEGVMFSILIMNSVAPFLNNLTVRMYGHGKKGSRRLDASKIDMEFDIGSARPSEIPSGMEGGKDE